MTFFNPEDAMLSQISKVDRQNAENSICLTDYYDRLTSKKILATTAVYGPWLPNGEFDWQSYENLVREVIQSGSVPATNVDTTWAIYNDWESTTTARGGGLIY